MKKVHVTLGIPTEYQLATNDSGNKRFFSPAYEPSADKKPMTYSAARGSSFATEKLVIDLTSPKRAKKTVELEPVKPVAPKCPSGAKSGSASERLTVIKSVKVDFATKVVPGSVPSSPMTDSSVEKGKSTRMGSYERSTESEAGEFPEVCELLKVDLLEDVDTCAKFVDNVGKVVIRSDFL
ncbi:hypothetical protein ACFX12_013504 [Malus domestica]